MFNSNQYKMKIKNCLAIVLGTAALFTVTSCGNTKVKKDGLAEVDSLATTYVNPLFQKGPDPWALFHEGTYYYMHTVQDSLVLWKTTDVTDVKNAPRKTVWIPTELSNKYHLWAPEIHNIDGKWYYGQSPDVCVGECKQRSF